VVEREISRKRNETLRNLGRNKNRGERKEKNKREGKNRKKKKEEE
jgi:hypothetical protein